MTLGNEQPFEEAVGRVGGAIDVTPQRDFGETNRRAADAGDEASEVVALQQRRELVGATIVVGPKRAAQGYQGVNVRHIGTGDVQISTP